jgi:hypothetical protein
MVRDPTYKLRFVKTLRLSEALLRKIKAACTARNLRFSDFMRLAALAALNSESVSCTRASGVMRVLAQACWNCPSVSGKSCFICGPKPDARRNEVL